MLNCFKMLILPLEYKYYKVKPCREKKRKNSTIHTRNIMHRKKKNTFTMFSMLVKEKFEYKEFSKSTSHNIFEYKCIQCKIANIKSNLVLNNNNGIFHQTKVKQHVYNMGYKNQSMK